MSENREAIQELMKNLRDEARRIRQVEEEASQALHGPGGGDKERYESLLKEKCAILQSLSQYAPQVVRELPEALGEWAADELEGYGHRAGQALSVGSVFFMSALLYPEDYQDGQENDLERFLSVLEKKVLG